MSSKLPRSTSDDYTRAMAEERRRFLEERRSARLAHVGAFSLDPATLAGNVEHFVGVAQVPIGIAGPLLVNGEHARGEFYVPLARPASSAGGSTSISTTSGGRPSRRRASASCATSSSTRRAGSDSSASTSR